MSQSAPDRNNPRDAFRNFLDRAEQDAWISSYRWVSADTYGLLKLKLGGPRADTVSRTHKKGTDGVWWALEVEAHEGTQVGCDLEIHIARPVLDDPQWITERLNIARSSSPQKILEEWSSREAAFKALWPDNAKILMSHFRRASANGLSVFTPAGERSVQVRSSWGGKWIVSLAWKSGN